MTGHPIATSGSTEPLSGSEQGAPRARPGGSDAPDPLIATSVAFHRSIQTIGVLPVAAAKDLEYVATG